MIHLVVGYSAWKEAGIYSSTACQHGQIGTFLNFTNKKLIQVIAKYSGDSWQKTKSCSGNLSLRRHNVKKIHLVE